MRMSVFVPFSLATVAREKALGSMVIEATPTEVLPFIDGEITDQGSTFTAAGVGRSGQAFHSEINTGNTYKATWLPFGQGNRRTAPDVQIGEKVMLYRAADQDAYFWEAWGGEEEALRRLETVILSWSGTKNGVGQFSPENSYYLEISTHRGSVTFGTSDANGEFTTWNFQINTKDGIFNFLNGIGDRITVDAKQKLIEMENSVGLIMSLFGKLLNITVPEKTTLVSPDTLIDGNVEITGNLTVGKNLEVGGDFKVAGGMTGGGNAKFAGTVVAADFVKG